MSSTQYRWLLDKVIEVTGHLTQATEALDELLADMAVMYDQSKDDDGPTAH